MGGPAGVLGAPGGPRGCPECWGCPSAWPQPPPRCRPRPAPVGVSGAGWRRGEPGPALSSRSAVRARMSQRRRGAPALPAPLLRFPSFFLVGCEETRAAQGSRQTAGPRTEGGAAAAPGSRPPGPPPGRAEGKRRLGGRLQLALGALAMSLCKIIALWKIISFLSDLLQFLGQKYVTLFPDNSSHLLFCYMSV